MHDVLYALAVLAAGGSSGSATSPESPVHVVASCPSGPVVGRVPGSLVVGPVAHRASLFFSFVAAGSPVAVRSHAVEAFEMESTSVDAGDVRRVTTRFDTSAGALTLVCQYGTALYPAPGTSMVLVPMPERTEGECVVESDLRRRNSKSRRSMTSVCIGAAR